MYIHNVSYLFYLYMYILYVMQWCICYSLPYYTEQPRHELNHASEPVYRAFNQLTPAKLGFKFAVNECMHSFHWRFEEIYGFLFLHIVTYCKCLVIVQSSVVSYNYEYQYYYNRYFIPQNFWIYILFYTYIYINAKI